MKTANLQRLQRYLADQKTLLKPTPASGTVIDTRTNKMWTRNFQGNPVDADNFCKYSGYGGLGLPTQTQGPRTIIGLPFGDWQLPDEAEFRALIDGHGEAKPVHWLWREAGMSQLQTDAPPAAGLAFMRGESGWRLFTDYQRRVFVRRFDLWNDRIDTIRVPFGPCDAASCECYTAAGEVLRRPGDCWGVKLKPIKGATMYVRDLGANESYWWQ